MPPAPPPIPPEIVMPATVTCANGPIVKTVQQFTADAAGPGLTRVASHPRPVMVRFVSTSMPKPSANVPAPTWIVSPEPATEMAWLIVRHGSVALHVLFAELFPVTSTYNVLAVAREAIAWNSAAAQMPKMTGRRREAWRMVTP